MHESKPVVKMFLRGRLVCDLQAFRTRVKGVRRYTQDARPAKRPMSLQCWPWRCSGIWRYSAPWTRRKSNGCKKNGSTRTRPWHGGLNRGGDGIEGRQGSHRHVAHRLSNRGRQLILLTCEAKVCSNPPGASQSQWPLRPSQQHRPMPWLLAELRAAPGPARRPKQTNHQLRPGLPMGRIVC